MFKKVTLIALIVSLAAAFAPVMATTAEAAPSGAIGDGFAPIEVPAPSDSPRGKAELECQKIANRIAFNEDWPMVTSIGTTFGLQYTTHALKEQWIGQNCQQFNNIKNKPTL